ncbi:hypothetical protein ACR3K2_35490 [Cryptosporidium serpentis]
MKKNLISNYFIIFLLFNIFLLKIKKSRSSTETNSDTHDTVSSIDTNLLSIEDILLLCNDTKHLLDHEKNKVFNLLLSYKNNNDLSVEDESKINKCLQILQSEINKESTIDLESVSITLLKIPIKMPKLLVFEVHPTLQLPVQPLKYVTRSTTQITNIREEDVTIPLKDTDVREVENYDEESNTMIDSISNIGRESSTFSHIHSEDDQSENNRDGGVYSESSHTIISDSDDSTSSSFPYNTDHSSILNSRRSSHIGSSILTTDISD